MLLGHRASHRVDHFLDCDLAPPLQFPGHHQDFLARHFNRKCGPTTGLQSGVRTLGGEFDVLGIEVASSNDDQVFQPSGNEEFTITQKPQITGAEEGAGIRVLGEAGTEVPLAQFGFAGSSHGPRTAR